MKNFKFQKGQSLVLLLFFVLVGMAVMVASSFIIAGNSAAATNTEIGQEVIVMAENGIETAYLQILRNGDLYTGETINYANGNVVVTVTGTTTKTVDSVATFGDYTKKVEVTASYSNNILTPLTWKEIN